MFYGDYWIGTADHIPGLFFVRTRFLHVMFVPLIPRQSALFLDQKPEPVIRALLPLSWRSAILGWLRGMIGFVAALIFFMLGAVVESGAKAATIAIAVGVIAVAELAMWGLYRITFVASSPPTLRAEELTSIAGLANASVGIAEMTNDDRIRSVEKSR